MYTVNYYNEVQYFNGGWQVWCYDGWSHYWVASKLIGKFPNAKPVRQY
jgi:hypothetical protein